MTRNGAAPFGLAMRLFEPRGPQPPAAKARHGRPFAGCDTRHEPEESFFENEYEKRWTT